MKKMLSFIVVLVIAFSMSTTAFAIGSEINSPEVSASVDINYKMDESYTVIIPSDIDFKINYSGMITATSKVSAENIYVPYGKTLNVKLSSENYSDKDPKGWRLVDQSEVEGATLNNTLAYIIGTKTNGSEVADKDTPAFSFDSGELPREGELFTGSKIQQLYFTITDQITKAGNYTDTLTFTVSVDDTVTTP